MRRIGVTFAAALAAIALALSPGGAAAFDCAFFEDQAAEGGEPGYGIAADFAVRMLEACRALEAYRARLAEENVRYAYGEGAVAQDVEANMRRAERLDTFNVLPEIERYAIAYDAGVFRIIAEGPTATPAAGRRPRIRVVPIDPEP